MVRSVEFLSPSEYRVGDHPREPHESLVEDLCSDLYRRLYLRPGPGPSHRGDPFAQRRHLQGLRDVCGDLEIWKEGWTIQGAAKGTEVPVEYGDVVFRAPRAHLRTADGTLEPGQPGQVRVPATSSKTLPGFFLVRGMNPRPSRTNRPHSLRLYWHLRPTGAVTWMELLSKALNQRQIPFQLKVLLDPSHYHRADAAVLYLEPGTLETIQPLLVEAWQELHPFLRPAVPALTFPLAPGLGVAEGPPDGMSFGTHRCGLVAEALVSSLESGHDSQEQRIDSVWDGFRREGLDPIRPYLAAKSSSDYVPFSPEEWTPISSPRASSGSKATDFLHAARAVGDRLCQSAFWSEDRCNWVGVFESGHGGTDGERELRALGPELYDGSSGVALFLAALYQATEEGVYGQTAKAAAWNSLDRVADRASASAYFTGRLGLRQAVQRVGEWVEDEALRRVVLEEEGPEGEEEVLDFLNGAAGALLGWIGTWRSSQESRALDVAVALGEKILAHGQAREGRWTWPNGAVAGMAEKAPPLTGLSHGAAGLGLALLELHSVTQERKFLEAARGAFAYEDEVFDPQRKNWPDFRQLGETEGSPTLPGFAKAWCHGAPGIVLSRLRAMELDPEHRDRYEFQARAGLETTQASLERRLVQGDLPAYLCHGTFGLIEVLALAGKMLDDEELLAVAHGSAKRWLEGQEHPREHSTSNPTLFLGEAGIGYVLLRLEFPGRFPSPLLPF